MKRLMMTVYVDDYGDAQRVNEMLKVAKISQNIPTLDWDMDWEEEDDDLLADFDPKTLRRKE